MPAKYRLRPGFSHNHGGRDLRPGEVVELNDRQARAFADRFELVDQKPAPTVQEMEEGAGHSSGLRVESRGGGWYDVVNDSTEEKINDAPLRKEQAEELAGTET